MEFGEAVTVTTTRGLRRAVYVGQAPAVVGLWLDQRLRFARPGVIVGPWTCPACAGGRAWWSLTHEPTCAACTPMPTEAYEAAWRGAAQFVEALAEGVEDRVLKVAIVDTLDQAVTRGSLMALLRLCLVHEGMKVAITRRRTEQEQHGGESS